MKEWIKIAFRNTVRQKKRSYLLGGAIAFGFLIITLLNGFTSGLVVSVKENFSGIFGGHIFITGEEITERGSIVGKISSSDVLDDIAESFDEDILRVVRRSGMSGDLIFGSKKTFLSVDGIDYSDETGFFSNIELIEGSLKNAVKPGSIIIPDSTADKLGIQVGESVLFSTTTVTGQKNVGEFVLQGIFKGQASFGISSAYASITDVNDLIGLTPEGFISYNLYLYSMEDMDRIGDEIYDALQQKEEVAPREGDEDSKDTGESRSHGFAMGGMFQGFSLPQAEDPWEGTKYNFVTLNEMMSPIMSLVNVLKTISQVVFIILIVITMVGIMNTFRMILIERTNEIGTMRAIGVQRKGILSIFVWEAGIIAASGAAAGFIISLIIMLVMSFISFSNVTALSFFLREGSIYFSVLPNEIITNFMILITLSLVAAFLPARAASKLKPAEALRAEY